MWGSWQWGHPAASSWCCSTCTVHKAKPNLLWSRAVTSCSTISASAPASRSSREGGAHCWQGQWDPPATPWAGHSPTATCTDTAGWLSVSAQRCRSWTPRTPLAPSSSSFTASNSRPRGAPASTTLGVTGRHPGPPDTAPTWVRAPGWAWWPWGETGLTLGPLHLAGVETRDWGGSGGTREGQRRGAASWAKSCGRCSSRNSCAHPAPGVSHPSHSLLTFHEDPEDVSEDGDGGAKDEDREEEGADGVCDLALGLQRAGSL